jgi:hypothetical protein
MGSSGSGNGTDFAFVCFGLTPKPSNPLVLVWLRSNWRVVEMYVNWSVFCASSNDRDAFEV